MKLQKLSTGEMVFLMIVVFIFLAMTNYFATDTDKLMGLTSPSWRTIATYALSSVIVVVTVIPTMISLIKKAKKGGRRQHAKS